MSGSANSTDHYSSVLSIIIFIILIIILIIAVGWIIAISSDVGNSDVGHSSNIKHYSLPYSKKWSGQGVFVGNFVGNDTAHGLPSALYTEKINLEFTVLSPPEVQMKAQWTVLSENGETLLTGEDVGAGIIGQDGSMRLSNATAPSSILIRPQKDGTLRYTLTLIAPNINSSSGVVDVILYATN